MAGTNTSKIKLKLKEDVFVVTVPIETVTISELIVKGKLF